MELVRRREIDATPGGATDAALAQGELEARARLAALQAHRQLTEAVEAHVEAQNRLRELGLVLSS